ncbi:hypothetical protein [uncultured Thermomonospora sp.]|nr:hypothetical protein [uncultured Thermomonospora sp.]
MRGDKLVYDVEEGRTAATRLLVGETLPVGYGLASGAPTPTTRRASSR